MIVLRNKTFVEKDDNYDKFVLPKPFPINQDWIKAGYSIKIEVDDNSKSYQKDYKSREISEEWRKAVKKIRRSIKSGHIYDDGDSSERTHYYPADSKPGKRYYVSKDINPNDRLMYDLHAPILYTNPKTGETYIQLKVALLFCAGHTKRNGKKFSETQ